MSSSWCAITSATSDRRPYNEEEDITEDEGQAVIKLPVRKPRAKRAPKPQQPETAAEDEASHKGGIWLLGKKITYTYYYSYYYYVYST